MSTETHACGRCAHLHREQESWELPNVWWWECAARPGMANLRSFPFIKTTCPAWEPRKPRKPLTD